MNFKITFKHIALAWMIVILGSSLPSSIEQYIAPVIKNVEFSTATVGNVSTIKMSYEELRECTLKNINWYIGSDNSTQVQISTNIQEADVFKLKDGARYITWTMNAKMSTNDIPSNVYVEHICHPFWMSLTKIR